MHRFVTTAGLAALLGGCAAVDMPDVEATHPDWVEERLEAGVEDRAAPRTVPERTLPRGEGAEMDAQARRLLERRDALNAEAEDREGQDAPSSASDFVNEGQARTTPPQDPQS